MEQYIIKGGNPLVGEVEIGGAKNAALAILAAAIMTDETVLIDNLPDVNDINVLLEAIQGIGAMVQRVDRHTVKINGSAITDFNIEYDYIKKIRASYYLLGAMLGKYKRAEVALPGGCNIGSRPIDQHLKGFRALGADVDIEHGKIVAEAEHLRGGICRSNDQRDDGSSHGGRSYDHGERCQGASCRRCCELLKQHGSKHPRCRNRCNQDPWSQEPP
jgi:UDP-N-acetylglucosamine 1-carboxyvinyltransferase